MVELIKGLYCGKDSDYEWTLGSTEKWKVVHACKEPYHRLALGYTGRGAPKESPEYLYAYRGDELCLNLVDAEDVAYIGVDLIDCALKFISEGLRDGSKVLVHCNQGRSRSAGICMLYLAQRGIFKGLTFLQAEMKMQEMYPEYAPARGIREYVRLHWVSEAVV